MGGWEDVSSGRELVMGKGPLYGLFLASFKLQTDYPVPPAPHPPGLKMKTKLMKPPLFSSLSPI